MQAEAPPRNEFFDTNEYIFEQPSDNPEPEFTRDYSQELLLPAASYEAYTDVSETISVDWYGGYHNDIVKEGVVSTALANAAVADDRVYEYVTRVISTKAASELSFRSEPSDQGEGLRTSIPISAIAAGVAQLQESFSGDSLREQRAAEIARLTSAEQMKQDYQGNTYRGVIDGALVEIPVTQLLDVLTASDEDYQRFVESGEHKEQVAYALVRFANANEIFAAYTLDSRAQYRYAALKSYQDIDFEALNKLSTVADNEAEYRKGFAMNDELRAAILEGVPDDADPLERSIHIYLNMCKVLTYDPEYYAVNPAPMYTSVNNPAQVAIARKFGQIGKASRITPENNEAVCFEFNLIFEEFLGEQGIDYKTLNGMNHTPYGPFGDGYGDGHEYAAARIDNFLVSFDSVTKVMGGDLANVKLGLEPVGIRCHNVNPATQTKFSVVLDKVYQQFQESNDGLGLSADGALERATVLYSEESEPIVPVPVGEKMSLWITMVNEAITDNGLKGVDAFAYAAHMYKRVFTPEEREQKVRFAMIHDRARRPDSLGRPGMVVSMADETLGEQTGARYFAAGPSKKLSEVTFEQLAGGFASGQFVYMSDGPGRQIPGLGAGLVHA